MLLRIRLTFYILFLGYSQTGWVAQKNSQHPNLQPSQQQSTEIIHKELPLNQAESQWLAKHPVIPIGGESNWPPFDFVDEQTRHVGIAADLLKTLGDRLGVQFEVETRLPWQSMLAEVRNGKLYAACAIAPTPSRQKDFLFTTPYVLSSVGIIIRTENNTIQSLSDLTNKRVAIPSAYASIELLKIRVPEITFVKVNSFYEALQLVQSQQVDAAVGSIEVTAYLIDHFQLSNLKVAVRDLPIRSNDLRIGVSKRYPILASILQKALNSISLEESNMILKRWVTNLEMSQSAKKNVQLTAAEHAWLASHSAVHFTADPNWLPFEAFNKQGEYIGIVAEILRLIEMRTGIYFDRKPSGTWLNAIQMVKNGEIDVLSDDIGNEGVKEHLNFTDPYLEYPMAIVMRESRNKFIADLYTIANKRIAVIDGYGYTWELFEKYQDIDFVKVANIQEALIGVSTGSIDAFVASFNLISYHINQMGLNKLHIVGQVPLTVRIGLGVRKDMPELLSILNKAIATLNEAEKFHITETWMQEKYIEHTDYTLLKRVLTGAALLLFLVVLWNRILKNQVQKRTESLQKSEQRYRQFVETNTAGILYSEYHPSISVDLPVENQLEMLITNACTAEINTVLAQQLGYDSAQQCQGKNLTFHIDSSDPENLKNIQTYISSGYRISGVILHAKNLEGTDLYFYNNAQGVVEEGFLKGTWLSLIDITQRLEAERALQISEEKFSKSFESSPDAMTIFTLHDACYKDVNKSFEKISGFKKAEVLGRTPFELHQWNEPRKLKFMQKHLQARTELQDIQITFMTKAGNRRTGVVSGDVIDLDGIPHVILVIRDITDQIRQKKKIRQQELQLIQANKMTSIGMLLSCIGHEINNPNNLIMLNAQIVLDAWPDVDKAMAHYHKDNPSWQLAQLPYVEMKKNLPELISGIRNGGQRIQTIVSSLRDFVRPTGTEKSRKYQANDAVHHALALLKYLIQCNTDCLNLQLAETLPLLKGNSQKLEQVITNLVINALESLPDRSSAVSLSSRYNASEKMIEIEVADKGTGIAQSTLKKIREPFFSTKLDTGGTGLGTRAIIHLPENVDNEAF